MASSWAHDDLHLLGSGFHYVTVDLSSTDQDFSPYLKAVYVGNGGDLKVTSPEDDTLTFQALAGGVIHPIQVAKIFKIGTTASGIVGIVK